MNTGRVEAPLRLPFIDGIRGLAAFVVLVGHLLFIVPTMFPSRHGAGWLLSPFWLGNEMVMLFITISGFALYYSEAARRRLGRQPTTVAQFAARRAWRIGPVYYVAVALGLLAWPAIHAVYLRPENRVTQHLDAGGVISHLVFVHNLRPGWLYQINGPLWSIAFEAQLYLLFPLIFWAMRRWNPFVVAVLVAGPIEGLNRLGHLGFPVFGLAPWFVAGCLLAELAARGVRVPVWPALAIGGAALVVGVVASDRLGSSAKHDVVWLVAFAFLIAAMMEAPDSRRNPLSTSVMRWLGLRSYSLYALHAPLVTLLIGLAAHFHLRGSAGGAFVTLIGAPVAIAIAAVSFRYIERPSLDRMRQVGSPSGAELRPVG